MNIFQRLFGRKPNPTAEWPELPPGTPKFDLRTMQIGPLRLGTPLADARALGRPDQYLHRTGTNPDLVYLRSGFSLEYEESVLVFVTYFTGKEEGNWAPEGLVFSKPVIIANDGTSHEFHAETGAEALVAAFGKPDHANVEEDESVLSWEKGGTTIEAELNERGRLRRLNVFLTN